MEHTLFCQRSLRAFHHVSSSPEADSSNEFTHHRFGSQDAPAHHVLPAATTRLSTSHRPSLKYCNDSLAVTLGETIHLASPAKGYLDTPSKRKRHMPEPKFESPKGNGGKGKGGKITLSFPQPV